MSQLKPILTICLGFLTICGVFGAPITVQMSQQMYEDLMTKDLKTFLVEVSKKEKNESVIDELGTYTEFEDRLKAAREKSPHIYILMKEYSDALLEHMKSFDNYEVVKFYADYVDSMTDTIAQGQDLQDNFVKLMKIVVPKWLKLNKEAQDTFAKQFPEIANILNDENVQKLGKNEPLPENPPKKDFWMKVKEFFSGSSDNKPVCRNDTNGKQVCS